MKFTKLKLKNFRPYRNTEIPLFIENRKEENMTLNVGRTGAGKTSISKAILWCLYGDLYLKQNKVELKEWVNDLQKEISKERGEDEAKIQVSLSILNEGKKYRITRSNRYVLDEKKFKGKNFNIIHQGNPIGEPEKFINEHFVSMELMEYFVFDAEQVLERFNKDRKGTIKENLNDLIGIEKFDEVKKVLNRMVGEDGHIQSKISEKRTELADEDLKEKIQNLKETKKDINKDLEELRKEKRKLEKEKNNIFKGEPSEDVKTFDELKTKEENLKGQLEDCVKEYQEAELEDLKPGISDKLTKNLDYLFITDIVKKGLDNLNSSEKISRRDYERAKNKIKTAIQDEYSGLYFDSDDIKVLKASAQLNPDYMGEEDDILNRLDQNKDLLNESKARAEFEDAEQDINIVEGKINDYISRYNDIKEDLIKTRNKINNLQETAEREEDRKKLRDYEGYEKKIENKEKDISDYKESIEVIKKKIKERENENEYNKDRQLEIKKYEKYEGIANELIDITKESKKQYTGDLLSEINNLASDFLRRVSKKNDIYHSIQVSSDYSFKVLNKDGKEVSNNQFNRGNRQIALMAFFISISSYLAKHQNRRIPYVIDDPLFRLDPGHDRRLLKELGKTGEQVILHLIPEKEYRADMFNIFSVNNQNWIDIKNDRESKIEIMDPQEPIDYDIETF